MMNASFRQLPYVTGFRLGANQSNDVLIVEQFLLFFRLKLERRSESLNDVGRQSEQLISKLIESD
jgi:hypothetical protein